MSSDIDEAVTDPEYAYMSATLYVRGDAFDPASMVNLTNVEPESAWVKGYVRTSPKTGRMSITKDGLWTYGITSEHSTVAATIEQLLKTLGARIGEASSLPNVENAYIDVLMQRTERSEEGGSSSCVHLPCQLINEIAARGLDLTITVSTSWDG